MKKPSQRTATLIAGALGALVVALPLRGYADSYRSHDYDEDYNRSYSGTPAYSEGQAWREWWHNRPGHDEESEGREGQQSSWNRLQHERREMNEARQQGDWDEYREERREAQDAARAWRDQGASPHYGEHDD
jgi:hypothetical protein